MANEEETTSEAGMEKLNLPGEDAKNEATDENGEQEDLTLLLEDARTKADEHWNQLLLAKAEVENTRRRARQDIENAHKFAIEKFVLELLPVKDSLEMGLAAADNDSSDNEIATQLKEGTGLTLKMLTSALEKFGIEAINPTGDNFDPALHQAMSMQESADHAPNTVMMVVQKGYQLNERLIRPAMVVVSKAAANKPASETDEASKTTETGTHVDEQA